MFFSQATRISDIMRVVEPTPLAAVLGANCKRIRTDAGVTQDELALRARDYGLRWTASKVGDFEAGRTAPTFATVLALSLALDVATMRAAGVRPGAQEPRVRLADLVRCDGYIAVTDGFDPLGARVAEYCQGQTWELHAPDTAHTAGIENIHRLLFSKALVDNKPDEHMRGVDLERMRRRSGLTEYRLASRLGISRDRLASASFRLWQKTFSERRDQLAGPDANAQKRGQVARRLRAELEKALADGNN